MSKKLDSILSKVPPAVSKTKNINAITSQNIEIEENKFERIVAVIPAYLKREIKIYLANNPKETERTLILKGLQSIGFNINSSEVKDKRGYKNK